MIIIKHGQVTCTPKSIFIQRGEMRAPSGYILTIH